MPLSVQSILLQNITLVYDSLDLNLIDRNKLRAIGGSGAALMDTQEMIVVVQPATPTIVQLGDRRIRITVQATASDLGTVPLWLLAHDLHTLVTKAELIAYGFNYDLAVELAEESASALQSRFVANRQHLEKALQGTLTSVVPRFQFIRDNTHYDLILESLQGNLIKAHLNAHFDAHSLPAQNVLEREYRAEYSQFVDMLPHLLED